MFNENPFQKHQLKFFNHMSLYVFLLKFIENHKVLNTQNAHEIKFWTRKEPTTKNLEPTKYPQENTISNQKKKEK